MLNQAIFVGRLAKDPELKELDNGKKVTNIVVAVQRSYKNADGVYDTDFVDCVLWDGVASNTAEYCKKGDMVGIKGRLETNLYENSNGEKRKNTQVIAEKITFLANAKAKDNDEDLAVEEDLEI